MTADARPATSTRARAGAALAAVALGVGLVCVTGALLAGSGFRVGVRKLALS